MNQELEQAYVLHTRPWRDSSALVDLLLCGQGRMRCVARGQRRQGGRNRGNICQPFRPLLVSLRGKGELKTLVAVEPDGPPARLPGSHLYAGFYANEILLRALPDADPHPMLFHAYKSLLAALATPEGDIEPPLRRFELSLLEELGYGIDFSHDATSGAELQPEGRYIFVAEQGFVRQAPDQVGESSASYVGQQLLEVSRGEFVGPSSRAVAKKIMRLALLPLLGDKPLNSRMLYRSADESDES